MSIIHEALKKVQSGFQRKTVQPEGQPSPQEPEEKKKISPFSVILALALLLGALYFGYNQFLKHWDNIRMAFDLPNVKFQKINLPKITISTGNEPEKRKILTETHPPVPMAKIQNGTAQETLNVQGILTQGGQTVALINDKIYEEGDEIGSIKIQTIDNSGITIIRDGKEEHIRVRP